MQSATAPIGRNRHEFEALYERHFGLVWSIVRLMGFDGAAREDLAQEAWTLAYRKLAKLRPTASAAAWLGALTRSVVLRHARSVRREARKRSAFAAVAAQLSPSPAARVDARTTVERVLAAMNPEQRLAFALVYAHGLSAPEVAAVTNVPMNTVYSRIRLAKRFLRRASAATAAQPRDVVECIRAEDDVARHTIGALLGLAPYTGATAATACSSLIAVSAWASVAGCVAALAIGLGAGAPQSPTPRPGSKSRAASPSAGATQPATPPRSEAPPPRTEHVEEPPLPHPGVAAPAPSVRPRRAARGRTRDNAPPRAAESPRLAEETRLLARANAALLEGAPDRALEIIGAHAVRFTHGSLADVREAVRVKALCAAGRTTEARRHRERLVEARPASSAAAAAAKTCVER